MSKFFSIILGPLLLSGPLLDASSHQSDQPTNILFIAIDDLKTIGSVFAEDPGNFLQKVYPDKELRTEVARRMTPNIQRLADQGITFMNAYCAAPACNPSRAALMTGIRPHSTGFTTNAGAVFFRDYEYQGIKPLADAITIPEYLKANGWYTASTGKIFHSSSSYKNSDGSRSWSVWTDVTGGAGPKTDSVWRTKALAWGIEGNDASTYRELNDYRKADFMARLLETGRATDHDTSFKLTDGQPFFLALGIFRPHLPFYATEDLVSLFPTEEMSVTRELLEEFTADGDDVPEYAFKFSGMQRDSSGAPTIGSDRFVDVLNHGLSIDPNDGDLQGWKDMLSYYFASCAIADRAVGRILDGLENSRYKDNTMVVLWSDHGYHLGEKLHVTKFALWDDAAQVNFFIKDPRNPQNAGKRSYRPVSLIDIYPTLMNLAKLDLPSDRITGHDLTSLLKDPYAARAAPAHTTYKNVANNMIRTERFKFIQYEDESRELYDLPADPDEYHNLAGKPETDAIEADMANLHNSALRR